MSHGTADVVERARFIDYFGDLGRHPQLVDGGVWYETGPGFMQRFPFHEVVPLSSTPGQGLFRTRRVQAARFGRQPAVEDAPSSSLWIRRRPYSIDDLSANTRSKVRRGLKRTRIERVDFSELRTAAIDLLASTAERQGVSYRDRDAKRWSQFCDVAPRHNMIEAWAGYVDDQLAIFAVCFEVENCFQISTVRSDSALLNHYPNNALVHTLMTEADKRDSVDTVCYGLASLDRSTSGLNDFKLRAGFEAEPIDDVILARQPFASARVLGRGLSRVEARSHRWAQAATVARSVAWWKSDEKRVARMSGAAS